LIRARGVIDRQRERKMALRTPLLHWATLNRAFEASAGAADARTIELGQDLWSRTCLFGFGRRGLAGCRTVSLNKKVFSVTLLPQTCRSALFRNPRALLFHFSFFGGVPRSAHPQLLEGIAATASIEALSQHVQNLTCCEAKGWSMWLWCTNFGKRLLQVAILTNCVVWWACKGKRPSAKRCYGARRMVVSLPWSCSSRTRSARLQHWTSKGERQPIWGLKGGTARCWSSCWRTMRQQTRGFRPLAGPHCTLPPLMDMKGLWKCC
jgi:hypothetical protein